MTQKSVSLVLSSGGARGIAHIGAIRCLEDAGYNIKFVSGSSIGALIGGIYATGQLQDYAQWVSALRRPDIVRLLDFGWGRGGGLFKGERIIEVLRDMIGEHLIEDLPIGYTAVATDLSRKREVWFNKGPLFPAIRASIAIPLVFSPVTQGNQVLIDGAVLNPLPLAPTLHNDADLIVAFDVNGTEDHVDLSDGAEAAPREQEDLSHNADSMQDKLRRSIAGFLESVWPAGESEQLEHGMLDIAVEAMDTMQMSIARHQRSLCSPDLTVQLPRSIASFFEFERASELIDIGYQRMEAALSSPNPAAHSNAE